MNSRLAPTRADRPRLKLPTLPDLAAELASRMEQIPKGRVATYGDLAKSLGDRTAAVWVARGLSSRGVELELPWHRVVRSTGELGGDALMRDRQARLLSREGNSIAPGPTGKLGVSLDRRIGEFSGSPPLRRLGQWLDKAAATISETSLVGHPDLIAGLDVAHPAPDVAVVAAVVVDVRKGCVLDGRTGRVPVEFPYIPGYLTFRELPALLEGIRLLNAAGWKPDVVFVDGQGRMHPRRAGVATGFAAVTGMSSVGVGKSLLHGRVVSSSTASGISEIRTEGELLGYALTKSSSKKPIYVSVGGWLALDDALKLTRQLDHGRRLPLPLHEADRLSKREVRRRDSQAGE